MPDITFYTLLMFDLPANPDADPSFYTLRIRHMSKAELGALPTYRNENSTPQSSPYTPISHPREFGQQIGTGVLLKTTETRSNPPCLHWPLFGTDFEPLKFYECEVCKRLASRGTGHIGMAPVILKTSEKKRKKCKPLAELDEKKIRNESETQWIRKQEGAFVRWVKDRRRYAKLSLLGSNGASHDPPLDLHGVKFVFEGKRCVPLGPTYRDAHGKPVNRYEPGLRTPERSGPTEHAEPTPNGVREWRFPGGIGVFDIKLRAEKWRKPIPQKGDV